MSKSQPTPPLHADHRKPDDAPDRSSKQRHGKATPDETDAAKRHLDEKLEEALEETFPASDPVAVTPHSEPPPKARKGRPPRHTKYGRPAVPPRKR